MVAKAPKGLRGGEIDFPKVTVGGTHVALMAATLAEGTTVIRNAAREPEVTDLATCLEKMGAKIEGAGTSEIVVEGVSRLQRRLPRRPAGSDRDRHLRHGGRDDGRRRGAREHPAGPARSSPSTCSSQTGAEVTADECAGSACAATATELQAVDVTTDPFPGFPTDLQAQFMALMTRRTARRASARRSSRTASCTCRNWHASGPRSGSTATARYVEGVDRLKGAPVMATDLRASVSLVIAGLVAEGETTINRVYHLDRGFEALETKLAPLAAPEIERAEGLALGERRQFPAALALGSGVLPNLLRGQDIDRFQATLATHGPPETRRPRPEDLAIVSAHLQDAILRVGDFTYLPLGAAVRHRRTALRLGGRPRTAAPAAA